MYTSNSNAERACAWAHPVLVLRVLQMVRLLPRPAHAQVSAIVVFSVLAAHGKTHDVSVFNGEDAPLNYSIGVGAFSFVMAVIFAVIFAVDQVRTCCMSVRNRVVFKQTGCAAHTRAHRRRGAG